MAQISIQRKNASPWMWVLGLVILGLLIWGLHELFDDDTELASGDVAPAITPAVDPTPLTDIVAIVAVPDRYPLVGRAVQLTDAPVQSVTGDETFWLGSDEKQRLFVALDPIPSTPAHEESAANVNPGQRVTVSGTIKRVPDDLTAMRTQWKMDDATAAALKSSQVYLAANQVTVTSR